jgi:hypothetical protein
VALIDGAPWIRNRIEPEFERTVEDVADAVDNAPAGRLIVDSTASTRRSSGVSLPVCGQCQRTRRRWMRPLIESRL